MENIKYEVISNKPFAETVNGLIKSLEDYHFSVMWQLNFKDKLKEKGIYFDSHFMILEVCNPQKAKEVLTRHVDAGYFLPCKVVVYEDKGTVKVGMMKPEFLLGMLGYADLQDIAKEVQTIMISAIDSLK